MIRKNKYISQSRSIVDECFSDFVIVFVSSTHLRVSHRVHSSSSSIIIIFAFSNRRACSTTAHLMLQSIYCNNTNRRRDNKRANKLKSLPQRNFTEGAILIFQCLPSCPSWINVISVFRFSVHHEYIWMWFAMPSPWTILFYFITWRWAVPNVCDGVKTSLATGLLKALTKSNEFKFHEYLRSKNHLFVSLTTNGGWLT